jgi:hypothetical protein
MKQQKIIVLSGSDYASEMEKEVNDWLDKGWTVVSVTAQHVATDVRTERGRFLLVIEKSE